MVTFSTYGSNSLKVVNTSSNAVVATVTVGNLPLGVDVSPNGALVYTANYLGNSVSAISTASSSVTATITVGTSPYKTRFVPDGSRSYVANSASNASVINTLTNTVSATVPVSSGGVKEISVTPDGTRAYLASSGLVRAINTATNLVTASIPFTLATHGYPLSIDMGPGPSQYRTQRQPGVQADARGIDGDRDSHHCQHRQLPPDGKQHRVPAGLERQLGRWRDRARDVPARGRELHADGAGCVQVALSPSPRTGRAARSRFL